MCEQRRTTSFNGLCAIPKMSRERLIFLLTLIGGCCVVLYPWSNSSLCGRHSSLLKRSAKFILSPMNTSIDPCEDFYGFACGSYAQNVSNSSNPMKTIDDVMLKNISDFLEMDSSSSDPLILHKARTLYRSCVLNSSAIGPRTRFESINRVLEQVGLSGTPPLDGVTKTFSYVYTMARAKVILNLNIFIKPVIWRENSTHVHLGLDKPTQSDNPFSAGEPVGAEYRVSKFTTDDMTDPVTLENFLYDARKYTAAMYKYANKTVPDLTSSEFNSTFRKLHLLDTFLDHAANAPIRQDCEDTWKTTAVKLSPGNTTCNCTTWNGEEVNFDWAQYIVTLMEDTPGMRINDDCILIWDTAYVKFILNWITRVMQPWELELYMWWKTITQLDPYTSNSEDGPERNSWCAGVVNDILPHATALMLVNRSDMLQAKMEVGIMADDIRNVFNSTISNAAWMNQTEKDTLSEKLMDMKICIGYPPWLEDSEKVDQYHEKYNEVNLTETDFLANILKLVQTEQRMGKLNKTEYVECDFKSLTSGAQYDPAMNELHIQYGFLQLPYYGLVLRALNFGSIGNTIGHELTHGFDYFEMTKLLNSSEDNATEKEYSHRLQCFMSDYDSYGEPNATETDWANEGLLRNSNWATYLKRCAPTRGQQTLNENLADFNGLGIAFRTYKDQSEKYGSESSSYGLEKYTQDQLYFIAYANGFCSRKAYTSFPDDWTDVHSPDSIRVWGVLRNSEDFAKAWGCEKGSRMNRNVDKCEIW